MGCTNVKDCNVGLMSIITNANKGSLVPSAGDLKENGAGKNEMKKKTVLQSQWNQPLITRARFWRTFESVI